MILCVTPNPALDRTITLPKLQWGDVARATATHVAAGGKGINVARAVVRLGEQAHCVAPLGGEIGQLWAKLAATEGITGTWTWHGQQTRESIILVDPHQPDATVINDPGPRATQADWDAFVQTTLAAARRAQAVAISGSLPPGVSRHSFSHLLRSLRGTAAQVWVDSSGVALEAALEVGGAAVKINAAEASTVLRQTIADAAEAMAAAQKLHLQINAPCIITLGAQGAVAATNEETWHVRPPPLDIVSSVGSGDCFLGGLVVGLLRNQPLPKALQLAAATGAANALQAGGGRFALEDVDEIVKDVVVQRV